MCCNPFKVGDRVVYRPGLPPKPWYKNSAEPGATAIVTGIGSRMLEGLLLMDVSWVRDEKSKDQCDGGYFVKDFVLASDDDAPALPRATFVVVRIDRWERLATCSTEQEAINRAAEHAKASPRITYRVYKSVADVIVQPADPVVTRFA